MLMWLWIFNDSNDKCWWHTTNAMLECVCYKAKIHCIRFVLDFGLVCARLMVIVTCNCCDCCTAATTVTVDQPHTSLAQTNDNETLPHDTMSLITHHNPNWTNTPTVHWQTQTTQYPQSLHSINNEQEGILNITEGICLGHRDVEEWSNGKIDGEQQIHAIARISGTAASCYAKEYVVSCWMWMWLWKLSGNSKHFLLLLFLLHFYSLLALRISFLLFARCW